MPASSDATAHGDPVADAVPDAGAGDGTGETKGERTRRRLLEIAVERFGTQGYKATSVSEIARAAGLTQAAVYAYFESKEQLFDAAVDADAEAAILAAADGVATTPASQLVPMVLVLLVGGLGNHPLAERVLAGKEPDTLPRLVDLPARASVEHVVRQPEPLEDALLNAEDLLVDRLPLLRRAKGEHLHLRELVHAVEAFRVAPRGTGLGPEAVPERGHLQGQLLFGQDLVHVDGSQGNLCRACQAQGRVLHRVHLQAGNDSN